MNISEIIDQVISLSDEELTPEEMTGFVNDGMAKISTELNANFPYFSLEDQTYEPPFAEKWQRLLLVVYAAARVKQKDSSQFEYQDLYQQFTLDLAEFKTKYTVPDEYKDTESEGNVSVAPNFTGNYYTGSW